ncbi:hypothetical protein M8J77_021846 [Diaphorina citri]|nr:hypothetical protein M8J77_021846 [Diaphorina citri]
MMQKERQEILSGNSDTATVVTHRLLPLIFATKVRILPYSLHRRTVCLRMEVLGCLAKGGVMTYNITKDKSWDSMPGLSDLSYDGEKWNGFFTNGLGKLVDGTLGGDEVKVDSTGNGKGNGWVGWRNDSFPKNFLEIHFEFDEIRNFSSVHIHCNNAFNKNVQQGLYSPIESLPFLHLRKAVSKCYRMSWPFNAKTTVWCCGTMFACSMVDIFSWMFYSTLIMLLVIFLLRHFKRKHPGPCGLKNECVSTGASMFDMKRRGDAVTRLKTHDRGVLDRGGVLLGDHVIRSGMPDHGVSILKKCKRSEEYAGCKMRSKYGAKQNPSSRKSVTIKTSVIEHE